MPAPYRSPAQIRNDFIRKLRSLRKRVRRSYGVCWEWQGNRALNGYGRIYVPKEWQPSRLMYVHILSYLLYHGLTKMPKDIFVCHRCDNPACYRPSHLFEGTAEDNNLDAKKKGRIAVGVRAGNSVLDEKTVRKVRRLLRTTSMTQKEIGEAVGISQSHVSYIKNYGWKSVS